MTQAQHPPAATPRRRPAADTEHRIRERTRVVQACARVVVTDGYGGATMTRVQTETGLARDQLYRLFPNNTRLLTEVYRRGHHRAAALNTPEAPRERIYAFAHVAVGQALSDPIVQAMHHLEMSPIATASGLPSIYRVWHQQLITALDTGESSAPAGAPSARMLSSADIAGVLVDALAGIIAVWGRCDTGRESARRSLDLLLHTLPAAQ